MLKPFSRSQKPLRIESLPSGCFAVHRGCSITASTIPSSYPVSALERIAQVVLDAFSRSNEANLPLTDLNIHFSGLSITAREMRGGALIFLQPATPNLTRPTFSPTMHYKSIEDFILHLENYIECWKQFNHYLNLARDKKFSREDESQFLEVKSVIAQGLEAILANMEKGVLKKEEVNSLFSQAPSLRHLSEMPDALGTVEAQWHKIFLNLQSMLGQLKVQQNKADKSSGGWSLFGGKK
jgi:hypothetical protein